MTTISDVTATGEADTADHMALALLFLAKGHTAAKLLGRPPYWLGAAMAELEADGFDQASALALVAELGSVEAIRAWEQERVTARP